MGDPSQMSRIGSEVYVLAGTTLATSIALTLAMRNFALSRGLLDVPNERSSHKVPTPRGGGAAITLTAMTGFAILAALHRLDLAVFAALGGGLVVAAVGFVDDRHALPAVGRLSAHVTAALWALAWLGGLPALRVGGDLISLGSVGTGVSVLGIVWVVNLFNFMDGIDAIAASEAIFVACAGALLGLLAGFAPDVPAVALVFAAACCGFLVWNWPP